MDDAISFRGRTPVAEVREKLRPYIGKPIRLICHRQHDDGRFEGCSFCEGFLHLNKDGIFSLSDGGYGVHDNVDVDIAELEQNPRVYVAHVLPGLASDYQVF